MSLLDDPNDGDLQIDVSQPEAEERDFSSDLLYFSRQQFGAATGQSAFGAGEGE